MNRIVLSLAFAAVLSSPAAATEIANLAGEWESNVGRVVFHPVSPDEYRVDFGYEDEEIVGHLSGRVLGGSWSVRDEGTRECATMRDGTPFWGTFEIAFDETFAGFAGDWTYCDDETIEWTGRRVDP